MNYKIDPGEYWGDMITGNDPISFVALRLLESSYGLSKKISYYMLVVL